MSDAIGERAMDLTQPPTPTERAVMTMLMQRHEYQETTEDLRWLRVDAMRAVEGASDGYIGVSGAFLDTARHGEPGNGWDDSECFDEDVRQVLAICGREVASHDESREGSDGTGDYEAFPAAAAPRNESAQ